MLVNTSSTSLLLKQVQTRAASNSFCMGAGSSCLVPSQSSRIRPRPKFTNEHVRLSSDTIIEDTDMDSSSSSSSGTDSGFGEGDAVVLFPLRKRQKSSSTSNLHVKPNPQPCVWRRELSGPELDKLWEIIVPTAHVSEFSV